MPRRKVSHTVDEVVYRWLDENFPENKSEALNEILLKAMDEKKDVYDELADALDHRQRCNTRIDDLLCRIQKVAIEGNLRQRRKAEEELRKVEEVRESEKKGLDRFLNELRKDVSGGLKILDAIEAVGKPHNYMGIAFKRAMVPGIIPMLHDYDMKIGLRQICDLVKWYKFDELRRLVQEVAYVAPLVAVEEAVEE